MELNENKNMELNEYGVFLNPEIIHLDKYVSIHLAERDKKWYYGYTYHYSSSFACLPCMEIIPQASQTRNEALKRAINLLISKIERNLNDNDYTSDSKRMVSSIFRLKEYLYSIRYVQLCLFD